jgi:hypothetical protein
LAPFFIMATKFCCVILVLIVITIIGNCGSPSVLAQPATANSCSIETIDFSNRIIETQFEKIAFHNGAYTQKREQGAPDWLFTLSKKTSLYHFGKDTVRIIYVEAEHLSGSGSWEIVFGFVCSNNQMKKVLEQWSLIPPVISQKGESLSVTVWTEYRGAASPQGKTTRQFKWMNQSFVAK